MSGLSDGGSRCAVLRPAAGGSADAGEFRLAGTRSDQQCPGAAAGAGRHRRNHRRTTRLWIPRDLEAADASGGGNRLVWLCNFRAAAAAGIAPFDLPPLAVSDLRGFLALRETFPCAALQALADACVERLDLFRALPSEDELARRRKAKLSPEQDAMLVRWGYPYVFGTWFFHMTLTRRLSDAEKSVVLPAAEAWFASALSVPRRVEDICIFTQATPGGAFTLAERVRLRG